MRLKNILCLLIGLGLGWPSAFAQVGPSQSLTYTWASPTSVGQLGQYLVFNGSSVPRPDTYTIDWSISGAAPTACTFNAQGSSDGVNWYALDGGSAVSCTTSNMESIVDKPVLYIRINVVTWTSAGTVAFHFTGGH